MIGCGHNANSHAVAFRAAGYDITTVCARPESPRIQAFADQHNIPSTYDAVSDLLDDRSKWDGLLICVPVKDTINVLTQALSIDAPILVEKPVGYRSADLLPFTNRELPVIVGYNRRYYRTTEEAKNEVERAAPFIGQMVFPQSIRVPDQLSDDPGYLEWFYASVTAHGLDMARYIFGELQIEATSRLRNAAGILLGIASTFSTPNGSLIQFTANLEASSNFSITLDWPGRRFELKPLEYATVYEGLEVHGPTAGRSISAYAPKVSRTINLDDVDLEYNPGYVRQAETFAGLIRGEGSGRAARLEDAYAALVLAEKLAGETYPPQQ